jgi:hypothetical protein
VVDESATAEIVLASEAGATDGTPARSDRTALVERLADVRNWACLLAVVPPGDLATFELVVAGPAYATSAAGREVVAALRAERCLVVSLLPLGPLLRRRGAAERARAPWRSRLLRAPGDAAASMVEWRAELARRVRWSTDSGFDGVYLDDLDLSLAHIGRPHAVELIRDARRFLPKHLLLAQAVDWLPGDVTFDALGPSSPLAASQGEDEATAWWTVRAGPGTDPTVGAVNEARSPGDLKGPRRRGVDRQLLERWFDRGRDEQRRA